MQLKHLRNLLALALLAATASSNAQQAAPICACQIPNGPPNQHPYMVGYLGVYKNQDWAAYAKTMDFAKMTHLNLAFVNPPLCQGTCTAQSDMTLHANASLTDDALKAIVDAAHAHGTKVLISLGGASGDKNYMQFYNAGLGNEITDSVNDYVMKHNLDGVDVDIEQPTQMGVPYTQWVKMLVATLKPEGKLVTAAVAQYIQAGVQDEVLPLLDIINVMIYGNYDRSVTEMAWWANSKHVPKEKLTLGIGFYGHGGTGSSTYKDILSAYPNAWKTDAVGGGTYKDGATVTFQGENTIAKETQLGAQYGGVMIWELSQDDLESPHSLLKVMQKNLDPSEPRLPTTTPRRGGE